MKKLFLVLLAVTALSSIGIILSPIAQAGENAKGANVVVYYFHGTMRCPTCHKLEQYSKEAIEANFNDALASGKLEFKVVNVEDKGNEHYAKDYQLYTKSLILSLIQNGKETKWINLDKIWEYVGNKQRFIDYVKSGIADLYIRGHKTASFRVRMECGRSVFRFKKPRALARGASLKKA